MATRLTIYGFTCIPFTPLFISCFLARFEVFWGAFLAPILAVMVFNLIIFVCVIVVIIRHKSGRVIRKQEFVSTKLIIRLMVSISGVMCLFGLTWLFAVFTFSSSGLRETFQILFTVFNSLQGFFIFLFLLNAEALACWRNVCLCGSKPFHRPSTRTQRSQASTGRSALSYSRSGGTLASGTVKSDGDWSTLKKQKSWI